MRVYPLRRWTAEVVSKTGTRITTTIYGRTCSDAEETYRKENPDVRSVIVRAEQTDR